MSVDFFSWIVDQLVIDTASWPGSLLTVCHCNHIHVSNDNNDSNDMYICVQCKTARTVSAFW